MQVLHYIITGLIITSFPAISFSQSSSTDCPDFRKKPTSSKADYLEYLRKNQGKKVIKETPVANNAVLIEQPVKSTEKPQKKSIPEKRIKESAIINTKTYTTKSAEENQPKTEKVTEVKIFPENSPVTEPIPVPEKEVLPEKQVEPLAPKEEPSVSDVVENNEEVKAGTKKKSPFQKKLTRVFTKKNNKVKKANYNKCPKNF